MQAEQIEHFRKTQKYVMQMRPVFKPNALFSDETQNYVTPMEPEPGDTVKIRFRAGKNNIDCVYLISGSLRLMMKYEKTVGEFDFYVIEIPMEEEPLSYCFEIHAGKIRCFYNKRGISKNLQEYYSFSIVPGFHTPDWAKGAVMYQIFVDRFCNGDPTNDVVDREYFYIGDGVRRVTDWSQNPAFMGVREFYGGDLQGVWDKLDYLQDLGVDVIYFNPIFVSPSNHKYDIQDYDHIDPHFGKIVKDGGEPLAEGDTDNAHASKYIQRVTAQENLDASNAFFAQLVEEIHKRGMRVILDGVFNHCGSFNKWLDREGVYEGAEGYEPGAYVSEESPYHTFFKFHKDEPENWPYNGSYDGWWGHDTLPKLNYEESPKLQEYILNIARKWVSPPYSVDGWRLDVAADLGHSGEFNHYFWQQFRKAVKEANPEALILAEHYGDPNSWLQGNEWDSVMNYDAFMEPVTWFLTGMEKHSDEYDGHLYGDGEGFFRAMYYHMSRMQMPSVMVAMNELSNHDHSRFLTRTNQTVVRIATMGAEAASEGIRYGVFREAVMIQMTWPGAPTLYYGDEAGLCGWTDPDNRRTYPWGHEDLELLEFHRYMCGMHNRLPVLRRGSVKPLLAGRQLLAYGRMMGRYKAAVVINNRDSERDVELPVWLLGVQPDEPLVRIMLTTESGYNVGLAKVEVRHGSAILKMPPVGSMLMITHADEFYSAAALDHQIGEI